LVKKSLTGRLCWPQRFENRCVSLFHMRATRSLSYDIAFPLITHTFTFIIHVQYESLNTSVVTPCTCKFILTHATNKNHSHIKSCMLYKLFLMDNFVIKYSFARSHAVGHRERRGKQAHSQTNKKTSRNSTETHIMHARMQICTVHRHTCMRPRWYVNAYNQSFVHAYSFTLVCSHRFLHTYTHPCIHSHTFEIILMDIFLACYHILSFACAWKSILSIHPTLFSIVKFKFFFKTSFHIRLNNFKFYVFKEDWMNFILSQIHTSFTRNMQNHQHKNQINA